jgi:MOSC domain-containing protein YiiM
MAHISSIVTQPVDVEYGERLDYFIREPVETAVLIAGVGIEGDRKAGRQPSRQLNLLSESWLNHVKSLSYKTKPGEFGEQIILSGLAVEELAAGDRLVFDDGAAIEITKPRTGCSRLEIAQGKSIAGIGYIGMLAKVITGGPIRVGSAVTILPSNNSISMEKPMTISGKFKVDLRPLDFSVEGIDGLNLGRMSIDKTFYGELSALSKGEMLSARTAIEGSAGYVALEQVTGTLSGKRGSFVLQHFGTMSPDHSFLLLEVVPDSGTGELAGISGKMAIRIEDGQHYYEFDYDLTS